MIKFIFLFFIITSTSFANSIIVKIDDEPISKYDLDSYINLAKVTGQISDSETNKKEIEEKLIEQLIDQKIKLNEIENLGMQVSQEQLNMAIANIEKQSRAKPGSLIKLLKSKGVSENVLYDKLKSDIGWFQILNYKFGKNITVSDAEIESEIKKVNNNIEKPFVFLHEIFIPVPSVLQDNKIYSEAIEMIEYIKKENNFEALAQQYSQSSSKDKGGAIGWIAVELLPEEFIKSISKLKEGDISQPIRTVDGYYILWIKDKENKQIGKKIDKQAITTILQTKKLEQFAKKYLRDLRNSAIIEKVEN